MTGNRRFLQDVLAAVGPRAGDLWHRLTEPAEEIQEPAHRRRARLLAGMLVALISAGALVFLSTLINVVAAKGARAAFLETPVFFVEIIGIGGFIVAYRLSRGKHYARGAFILIVDIYIADLLVAANTTDPNDLIAILGYLIMCVLLASWFLPMWGTVTLYGFTLFGIWAVANFAVDAVYLRSVEIVFYYVLVIGILIVVSSAIRQRDLDQIQRQARELVDTAMEIVRREQSEKALLERATRLEIITRVGRRTTAILELDELLRQAVNLLHDAFDYYNVNILFVDGDDVVLRATSLPALRRREGHIRLRIGSEGVTGWVASSGESLCVPDVSQDSRYYLEPEAREAKSEAAIPIKLKGEVIGVLDAQSVDPDAFSQIDVFALQAIADQLAIAIDNARLYGDVQQRIAEREQAEEALRRAHDELEMRVVERTAELTRSNEELHIEISERKRAERALQQAKRDAEQAQRTAEAANKVKSQFLATMSHELRTPLNGILGYAQILKRNSTISQRHLDGLNIIERSGTHLLTLINDILDLAKIEASRIDLYETGFDFQIFLQGIGEMFRLQAERQGLDFYTEFAFDGGEKEGLPAGVRGDERRLRQVLINLLGNALKFTDEGSVLFKVERVRGGNVEPFVLRFTIRDTGIGMSPKELDIIFEPFRQVVNQKRQVRGTGLGLTISYNLIELMGGKLQVESTLGSGTIFWFDLVLPDIVDWVKVSSPKERQIVGIKEKTPKVLVVDDNWQDRLVIVDLLSPLGFQVREAKDGREGLVCMTDFRPDVVIADLIMPEMNGIEFIRQLRKLPVLRDVIIIAISASAYDDDQQRSLAAGSDVFIRKPVNVSDLFVLLQRRLGLEWAYADSDRPDGKRSKDRVDAAAPMVLPLSDELTALSKLTVVGDVRAIQNRADELERADDRLKPFATELRRLAKGFQIEKIRNLLELHQE